MKNSQLLLLTLLSVFLIQCGKVDKEEKPEGIKPAVHKSKECPESIFSGVYLGTVQRRRMIYKFTRNSNGTLVALVTIEDVTKEPVPIPVNGKLQVTKIGMASMGCEDGKINTVSVLQNGLYKAQISFTDTGFELNEIRPQQKITTFNKVDE